MTNRRSRLLGSLHGLLVGDALGVPYEFHPPAALPPRHEIEMEPPPGFWRAHRGTPPGTWSDDGALALALLDALLDEGRPDANAIAARIVAWARQGRYAVDGRVFDIGRQTGIAVERIEQGVSPLESGGTDEYANGNGSLMRVAPLALWHRGTDAELAEAAHLQSLPTHAHPRSQVACALLSLTLRRILDGHTAPDEALGQVAEWLAAHYAERPRFAAELRGVMRAPEREEPTGTGYVVDTLWSALHAVRERDFEDALRAAIALGNDTDTTACVAGAIAGALHGIEAIPSRRMQALRGREIVELPVARVLGNGQRVAGRTDLVLRTATGWIVFDHKSTPQDSAQWEEVAQRHAGQLAAYREALAAVSGAPVEETWLVLPVAGAALRVELQAAG